MGITLIAPNLIVLTLIISFIDALLRCDFPPVNRPSARLHHFEDAKRKFERGGQVGRVTQAGQQLVEGKAKVETLSQELKSKEEALVQLQISSAQEIAGLKGQLNAATEKLDATQKLHQEQKAEAKKSKEAMKNEFKVLAESILEEKKKQFKTTNSEELDKLLAPFKQKLEDFEKTVKDNHEKEVKSTSR